MPEVITIQSSDLRQALSVGKKAAQVLESGGLVVFPTETVYGVAASVMSERGHKALCAIKGLSCDAVFAIHVADRDSVGRYVDMEVPATRRFVNKTMPGPVTLLVEVGEEAALERLRSAGISGAALARVFSEKTIGLRCPQHDSASMVLSSIDTPIIAGTAGHNGTALPVDAGMAMDAIRRAGDEVFANVGLVLDAGPTRYAKPSTIVRMQRQDVRAADGSRFPHYEAVVEREGVYDKRSIARLTRWTMLLICSGNTCRSPMAEGLAKYLLAEQRGIEPDKLERLGLRVTSAAAYGVPGMPAASEAVDIVASRGVDISHHRSRALTPDMIHEADVILCMTRSHKAAVLGMVPSAAGRTLLLDPSGEIEDPIGQGPVAYRRAAQSIERALTQRLLEQQP